MPALSPVSCWWRLGVLSLAFICGWAPQRAVAWTDGPVSAEVRVSAASRIEAGAWDLPRAVSSSWLRVERELPPMLDGIGAEVRAGVFYLKSWVEVLPQAWGVSLPAVTSRWVGVVELRL